MGRRTILVVEDNLVEQQIVSLLAGRLGLEAEIVPTAYQALKKLSSSSAEYAAVLMNYNLPVMDGPECAERIRAMEEPSQKRLPIIALTARVFEGSKERCLSAGMDDFLSKPYTVDEFKEMVERWCGPAGNA